MILAHLASSASGTEMSLTAHTPIEVHHLTTITIVEPRTECQFPITGILQSAIGLAQLFQARPTMSVLTTLLILRTVLKLEPAHLTMMPTAVK